MRGGKAHMKFCQNMLDEIVEVLNNGKLPYADSILIGDNASGKSEVLKQYMRKTRRTIYFIDAVNRNFNINAIASLNDKIQYKVTILEKRLLDENFNLKDTWSYYGTPTECIELLYSYYEERLQRLFKEFFGTSFSVVYPETQEVKYDFGDIGRISNGYQAVVRILLELLYFQDTNPVGEAERALVIIDEIDEYLSPKNAGKFFLFLKENFSEIDFIVTTHSAEVVAAATRCNVLVLHSTQLEILDAGDFKDIDDAMTIFKDVFGRIESADDSEYEMILRKLFNNRIIGVWGEEEEKCYNDIDEKNLTKTQRLLYRQIGEW